MTSATTDRRIGLTGGAAYKTPCKAVATTNITLSGLQTIGGVALVAGDRVLVTGQTDATKNGIWTVDTGSWSRALDFDGSGDFVKGTIVPVLSGSLKTYFYSLTTNNPVIGGSLNFSSLNSDLILTGLNEFRFAADAGGIGNGATDDATITANHAAAQLISGWIMAQGGGKIIIEYGDYKFGKQDFAGATGLGYAYKMRRMFYIHGCTKPVIFEFQACKLSLVNGIKYGSFNPINGAVYNPGAFPFSNADYIADSGFIIECDSNPGGVYMTGALEIDGNVAGMNIGGYWGENGNRQIIGYGIDLENNDINHIDGNFYIHHCALDGAYVDATHNFNDQPNIIIGMRSEYNGRQGLTIGGGRGNLIIASQFRYNGKSTVTTGPAAGIDIEAQQPGGEPAGKGIFRTHLINVDIVDNIGIGLVADSGNTFNILVEQSRIIGITNYALWANKPGFVLRDTYIHGGVVNTYTGTLFEKCTFIDVTQGYASPTYGINCYTAIFDRCEFDYSVIENLYIQSSTIKNSTFRYAFTGAVNQSAVINFANSTIENLTITDAQISAPADGVYIVTSGIISKGDNLLISATGKLKWNSWSAGAGAHIGYYGVTNPETKVPYCQVTALQVAANGVTRDNFNGLQYRWHIDALSTSGLRPDGTNQIGDEFMITSVTTAGSVWGYRCIAAGNPGSFLKLGTLST